MCRQGAVNGGQGSDREGLQLTVLAAAAVNVYPCRPGVAEEENNGARLRVDAPEVRVLVGPALAEISKVGSQEGRGGSDAGGDHLGAATREQVRLTLRCRRGVERLAVIGENPLPQ